MRVFIAAMREGGPSENENGFCVLEAPSPQNPILAERLEANWVDPNLKDVFCGDQAVRDFSARLAQGLSDEITDEEISSVLCSEAVPAFRYASRCLHGFVRRTTSEPTFCHSADIALRAKDLGFPPRVIQVALLHDTVEDRSKKLSEVIERVDELRAHFPADIVQDVYCSTNVYSVIIRALESRVGYNLPFDDTAPVKLRASLEEIQRETPPEIASYFKPQFTQLMDHFLLGADLTGGARKARIDKKYTVVSELRLQSYRLFVQDIHDDARYRIEPRSSTLHENVLAVKTLDLVDNLRTSEVANFGSLERILLKAETFLDCTFFLHEYVRERPAVRTNFIELYELLKYHLVEQLLERRRALVFLADTRFGFLTDYMMREITRLQEKYKVDTSPIAALQRLRTKIQEHNQLDQAPG